ncbi:MAG: HNH endonuclease [Gemmatimonadaceae bacterium]
MSWYGVMYRWNYGTPEHYAARAATRIRKARKGGLTVVDDGSVTGALLRQMFEDAVVCRYCERETPPWERSLDHVVPFSRGGQHSVSNVQVICHSCNTSKRHRTHEEHVVYLRQREQPAWQRARA